MPFIHDNFLLSTKTAQRLYHEYAVAPPILDYHCHLPPKDVAEKRQFADDILSSDSEVNLTELPDEELLQLVRLDVTRALL